MLIKLRLPAQGKNYAFRARIKFLCLFGEQLLKPNMLLRAQYPRKMDRKVKQQWNECKNHCRNQHSKELRLCYDCVEESVAEG